MTGKEAVNFTISRLSAYINEEFPPEEAKFKIILSNQTQLTPEKPYAYYTNIIFNESETNRGIKFVDQIDDEFVDVVLAEQFTSTISLTFVSDADDIVYFLCQKARDWVMHKAYHELIMEDIVVVTVSNMTDRTIFQLSEENRRWGFDITIRYTNEINLITPVLKVDLKGEVTNE